MDKTFLIPLILGALVICLFGFASQKVAEYNYSQCKIDIVKMEYELSQVRDTCGEVLK